ncbi:MAG: porin family protein [Cytophagaceae bacterium]|nr:porin family protein [Cytophagaceae bacterium]
MKMNSQWITAALFAVSGIFTTEAQAQLQLGIGANYVNSVGNDNSLSQDGALGGGVMLRYFIAPQVALTLNGRYLTEGDSGYRINNLIATAGADFFLSEGNTRPYLGAEAGVYHTFFTRTLAKAPSVTNFGVAPKAGILFMLNSKIGLDFNLGYHLIFYDGFTGKNLLLGAGLVFDVGQ